MLKIFWMSWLLYWCVYAALPVHSIYPAGVSAFVLQLTFVLIVTALHLSLRKIFGFRAPLMSRSNDLPDAIIIIKRSIILSFIGLVLLIYDKIFIQGIDYSDGIAIAREAWRELGEEREGGASSAFSALGYAFGSAYYVAVVLTITQSSSISAQQRLRILLLCFALLMLNSLLTGGRSSILLLLAFAVSAVASRQGIKLTKILATGFQRRISASLVLLALTYTVFVFYQRAGAGDMGALDYALDFLPFLGVEANSGFREFTGQGAFGGLSAIIVLALSYLTHSFSTVAAIADAPGEDKIIVFLHMFELFHKLGFGTQPDGDWFLSGRFPSLPGAIWHQFGLLGLLLGSVIAGTLSGLADVWSARRTCRLLPLAAYVLMGSILILSPALFAGDFLSYPFVVFSFLALAAWSRLRGGKLVLIRKRRPRIKSDDRKSDLQNLLKPLG